jgi:hypothetical protein
MSSSVAPLPSFPARSPALERLANVELQLIMHHLPWSSLQSFASCSRRLREAAADPFAFQFAHIACHGRKLKWVLVAGLNSLVRTLTPFNELEQAGIEAIRHLKHLSVLNMHAPCRPEQLRAMIYGAVDPVPAAATSPSNSAITPALGLQSLRALHLRGSQLDDTVFHALADLPRLQRLALLACEGVHAITLSLLQDLPSLDALEYEPIEAVRANEKPGVAGLVDCVESRKLQTLHLNLRAHPMTLWSRSVAGYATPKGQLDGKAFLAHPGLLDVRHLVLMNVNLGAWKAEDFASAWEACQWEYLHLQSVEFERPGDWSVLFGSLSHLKVFALTSPQNGFHPMHFVENPTLEMFLARALHAERHRESWLAHTEHFTNEYELVGKKIKMQVGWRDTPDMIREMKVFRFNPLDTE